MKRKNDNLNRKNTKRETITFHRAYVSMSQITMRVRTAFQFSLRMLNFFYTPLYSALDL